MQPGHAGLPRAGLPEAGLSKAGFIVLALALSATTFLSGCARRGGLEAPPAAAVASEEAPETRTTVPDRRFILDGLI